jgi:hypothetical protein
MHLSDPDLDALLDRQATQFEREDRVETLLEIQEMLWEQAYMPLFPAANIWAGHHPELHNINEHASGSLTAGSALSWERAWLDS